MEILRKIYLFLVDTAQTILIAASIFLVIYIFLFRPFQVSGDSMFPTYKDHQYILTNLIGLRFGDPKRGEVVVFHAPPDKEKDFIKRIIGLPGEIILLQDGFVYINGNKLDESSYLGSGVKTFGGSFLKDNQPFKIPSSYYFVMGDNRAYSSDSREWGILKKSEIIGRSMLVYWPPTDARVIHDPQIVSQ